MQTRWMQWLTLAIPLVAAQCAGSTFVESLDRAQEVAPPEGVPQYLAPVSVSVELEGGLYSMPPPAPDREEHLDASRQILRLILLEPVSQSVVSVLTTRTGPDLEALPINTGALKGRYLIGAELEQADGSVLRTAESLPHARGIKGEGQTRPLEVILSPGKRQTLSLSLFPQRKALPMRDVLKRLEFSLQPDKRARHILDTMTDPTAMLTVSGCTSSGLTERIRLALDVRSGVLAYPPGTREFRLMPRRPCRLEVEVADLEVPFLEGALAFTADDSEHPVQRLGRLSLSVTGPNAKMSAERAGDFTRLEVDIAAIAPVLEQKAWPRPLGYVFTLRGPDGRLDEIRLRREEARLVGHTLLERGPWRLTLRIASGLLPVYTAELHLPQDTPIRGIEADIPLNYQYDRWMDPAQARPVILGAYLEDYPGVPGDVEVTVRSGYLEDRCLTGNLNGAGASDAYECAIRLPIGYSYEFIYTAPDHIPQTQTKEIAPETPSRQPTVILEPMASHSQPVEDEGSSQRQGSLFSFGPLRG